MSSLGREGSTLRRRLSPAIGLLSSRRNPSSCCLPPCGLGHLYLLWDYRHRKATDDQNRPTRLIKLEPESLFGTFCCLTLPFML